MIICQTLWTKDKNLLDEPFGWLSPQHHIMAWALSVLRLKKYYPIVNLHTDKKCISLFRDQLNFPYTNFFDNYSDIECHSDLWALPKLLTSFFERPRYFLSSLHMESFLTISLSIPLIRLK